VRLRYKRNNPVLRFNRGREPEFGYDLGNVVEIEHGARLLASWSSSWLGAEFQGLALDAAGNIYGTGESRTEAYGETTGLFALKRARKVPPIITLQPQSQTAIAGNEVTLSVEASEPAPVAFQWQKNETNLIGRTNAAMVIDSVSPSDAGDYRVVLTNGDGTATSEVAALFVLEDTAPRLSVFTYTNGQFVFHVSGAASHPYRIEAADNFGAVVTWTPVFTNFVPFWYTNSAIRNDSRRFYQAIGND